MDESLDSILIKLSDIIEEKIESLTQKRIRHDNDIENFVRGSLQFPSQSECDNLNQELKKALTFEFVVDNGAFLYTDSVENASNDQVLKLFQEHEASYKFYIENRTDRYFRLRNQLSDVQREAKEITSLLALKSNVSDLIEHYKNENDNRNYLNEIRKTLTDGLKGLLNAPATYQVKIMGRLPRKPFRDAFSKINPKSEADRKAADLQEEWQRFVWSDPKGDDVENVLTELEQDLGADISGAVRQALAEVARFGTGEVGELWHMAEMRSASTIEIIRYILSRWK